MNTDSQPEEPLQPDTVSRLRVVADNKVVYEGNDDRACWAAIVKAGKEGAYYITCSANGVEKFRSRSVSGRNRYWQRVETANDDV